MTNGDFVFIIGILAIDQVMFYIVETSIMINILEKLFTICSFIVIDIIKLVCDFYHMFIVKIITNEWYPSLTILELFVYVLMTEQTLFNNKPNVHNLKEASIEF